MIAVFADRVVILSDKSVQFSLADARPSSVTTAWRRWHNRTVVAAAKQALGAERWLRDHPGNVYCDAQCTEPLPVPPAVLKGARYHRIVVVHDPSGVRRDTTGGSGSLAIDTSLFDASRPFWVGHPWQGCPYVHIWDETVLSTMLEHLDTASDLIDYLSEKESMMAASHAVISAGEEEVLARYLMTISPQGQHSLPKPRDKNTTVILEAGSWHRLRSSPAMASRKRADRASYAVDRIIESFAKHLKGRTLYHDTADDGQSSRAALSCLASLSRFDRRFLGGALVEALQKSGSLPPETNLYRRLRPWRPSTPTFLFVLLEQWPDETEAHYRERRRFAMEGYLAHCADWIHLGSPVLIFGTEKDALTRPLTSEDLMFVEAFAQHDEHEAMAKEFRSFSKISGKPAYLHSQDYEFPDSRLDPAPLRSQRRKRIGRNEPCPCGSGIKYKRCCGP